MLTLHFSITFCNRLQVRRTTAKKESIYRIIILHKLAKKQAILASIAILSSFSYWIISIIDSIISLQAPYDILINSVCVWLMFGCSHKYWKFCTKYCCCFLCYNKLNKIVKMEKLREANQIRPRSSN